MNHEILKPNETINSSDHDSGELSVLDETSIAKTLSLRKENLEKIKPYISRKLLYKIEEKIAEEEKQLKDILDWQNGKHAFFSKYTLVLDPRYFEQEFLSF